MAVSIFSNNRLRLFFAVWWLLWMLLQFIILQQINVDLTHALSDAIVSNIVLGGICYFLSNNMKYYLPRNEKYWYVLVLSLVSCLFWLMIVQAVFYFILPQGDAYQQFFKNSWGIRFGAGFLLTSSMAMFSLLWYGQQEQKEKESRKTETEKLSRDAELFKLRRQLQPHFLFNSLNSISALTASNPEKARQMINQLSDFLRGTLKKDEHQLTTFTDELQSLRLYLDIEKVRFGHRLQTRIVYDDESLACELPALILQPIVENAIKFGLYDTTGEVLISIDGKIENQYLVISVQNPFDTETSPPLKGTGFGLSSIKRRLFLLYSRQDLLKTSQKDNYFITILKIPQHK